MTKDVVLKMKAGEINRLIAEKVMDICLHANKKSASNGIYYVCPDCGEKYLGRDVVVRNYSDDISAAWEVVEKFRGDGCLVEFEGNKFWIVHITQQNGFANFAAADTAPLAICRAAALVVLESA